MVYLEYRPDEFLSRFIECFWTAEANAPPFQPVEALIPDGSIELMFNFGDPYWLVDISSGRKTPVKGCHIIGFRRESLFISQTANQNFFSIRFKPGGLLPFIKRPVHEFTQLMIATEDLFGPGVKELEDKMHEAGSADRIQLASDFLYKRYGGSLADFRFVKSCIDAVSPLKLSYPVDELSRATGFSFKYLERKFNKTIGATPGRFFQIVRFNASVKKMMSGQYRSLTDVAYDSGYYDQAHFIRKFKMLTHSTPLEFLKRQYTIVKVIQPALAKRLSILYKLE